MWHSKALIFQELLLSFFIHLFSWHSFLLACFETAKSIRSSSCLHLVPTCQTTCSHQWVISFVLYAHAQWLVIKTCLRWRNFYHMGNTWVLFIRFVFKFFILFLKNFRISCCFSFVSLPIFDSSLNFRVVST